MLAMKTVPESGWVFFSCVVPRPDGIGIEKRAWSHLMAMASVKPPRVILALNDAQLVQVPDVTFVQGHCESVYLLPLTSSWRNKRLSNTAAFIAQRLLLWGQPRWIPEANAAKALRSALGGINLDSVFCFRLACFELWRQLCSLEGYNAQRVIVDFDDIESLALQRALALGTEQLGAAHTIATKLEIAERRRLENQALNSHEVLVCSTDDAGRLMERQPKARVSVMPNAYPVLNQLPARQGSYVMHLLFLGTLSYPPNVDAAEHLIHDLLPELRKAWHGPVQLRIVGRRPGPRIMALHRPPEVEVQADVEDITTAYDQTDIVVVPIRYGGGTRIKILEALTLGRPIVSTTIGAEGLDLRHGEDLLIADTPADFAQACVRIARDVVFANKMLTEGRQRFIDRYSDDVVRERLRELLSSPLPPPARS